MSLKRLCIPVAAVVAVVLAPAAARGEDERAIKKITDMNRAAMEDYDLLEFESAKSQLSKALVEIKKAKLDKHPVAAKTHVNLGIVYGAGFKMEDEAKLEFMQALEIDPGVQIPVSYRDPALEKLFNEAKSTVGTGGGSTGGDDDGGEPDEAVRGLVHKTIDEADSGGDIAISAKVGADLKAKQVILYWRPQGAEDFRSAPMKGKGQSYEGKIPADATGGDFVHYYIEVKNDKGKVVAQNGSGGSPNIIDIKKVAAGGGGDDDDLDDENPLVGGGGGGGGDDDDDVVGGGGGGTTIRKKGKKAKHAWYAGVNVGSGFGFVTGVTEQRGSTVGCCFASAPFHVMPELGFWLNPKLMLSVYGRIGFPLGADLRGHATAAPAGFLRLTYALKRDGEGVVVHGDIGGGFIRHTIKLDPSTIPADQPGTTDTFVTGPLFIGGGASYIKPLGGPLRFVLDANVAMGIPVIEEIGDPAKPIKPQFAINTDVSIGLMFAF